MPPVHHLLFLLFGASFACLVSCGEKQKTSNGSRCVATVGMIADVASQIAGDKLKVEGLIGEGVDPHLYKPSTSDVKKLQAADIMFYNGLMLERKMSDVLVNIATTGKPVAVNALKNLPATAEIQQNVYYAMLSQALNDQYEFFIVWCYRDYDKLWDDMKGQIPEWGALWRDVGIVDGGGNERPSKQVWDTFRSLPLK